jgi:tetratricopeptide (TPR) repeat protein/transcriptional regulator with XRE-family HTH domain
VAVAEPPVVTFGTLLRRLRTRAGLSQEELAEAAGVGTRTVSDLERGVARTARKDTARLLAGALGLASGDRDHFEAVARGRATGDEAQGQDRWAPRALPRDITSFTGRAAELRQLVGASSGAVAGIHAIGGMAGVGKTTLAVHVAHQLAPAFPDGQIFLPLHAHDPGRRPVDPAEALAILLQTVGVGPGQIPAGVQARMAVWRDKVAARQLLLVLDDAAGSEQVRPLLPGTAQSLVLVTSRRHLTALEDAQTVSLDTLEADEAAELLARLAGRSGLDPGDPAVAQITLLCGCLPLAVGMMARQLRHHPAWTAAGLADDLAAARDRLGLLYAENLSVAAAFDLSYTDLAPGEQRLFRRLGLHPGPDIDIGAAAALDGTDAVAARRGLEGLYDHYLIGEPVRGRYRFHDLIREHARALAAADPPAERDDATGRLLDHYQHAAAVAGASLARQTRRRTGPARAAQPGEVPDAGGQPQAMAWMRTERANLLACVDYATATGQPGRVADLTASLAPLLRIDGPWTEAITRLRAAAQAARQLGDRLAEADALNDLGDLEFMADDVTAAALTLDHALRSYTAAGDRLGRANTLNDIGQLRRAGGDYGAAIHAHDEALVIFSDLGDRLGRARAILLLGNARLMASDWPSGAAAFTDALDIYRDIGHRLGEGQASLGLALARMNTGDYSGTIQAVAAGLAIARELGDRLTEAMALLHLGRARAASGDYGGGTQALHEALRIFTELGDAGGQALVLKELGAAQRATGDHSAAARALDQALGIFADLGDRQNQAEALNEIGTLHRVKGDPAGAGGFHRQALDLARQIGSPSDEAQALAGLGRCALAQADIATARTHLTQALDIFQRIGTVEAPAIAAELDALSGSG